jgi:DNA polymerase I
MSKYLVIDSSYLAYRSYFAYPRLSDDKGTPTGAIFGYAKAIIQLIYKLGVDYLVIAKDTQAPTFRHKELETYKGTRKPMEGNMSVQMPLIEAFSNLITKNNFAIEGFEADDIIYSVVMQNSNPENTFYILSGDRDLYQLFVFDNVFFVKEEKELVTIFSKDEFKKKYELEPIQWVDYKALVGDGSDNFQGLPGVGPVTATKLLNICGSIYNIIKSLSLDSSSFLPILIEKEVNSYIYDKKNEILKNKIIDNFDTLKQSYMLSKLMNFEYTTKELDDKITINKSLDMLDQLGMNSIVRYYKKNFGPQLIQEELF